MTPVIHVCLLQCAARILATMEHWVSKIMCNEMKFYGFLTVRKEAVTSYYN